MPPGLRIKPNAHLYPANEFMTWLIHHNIPRLDFLEHDIVRIVRITSYNNQLLSREDSIMYIEVVCSWDFPNVEVDNHVICYVYGS